MFYLSRGHLRSRKKDKREAARADYAEAIRLDPQSAWAWNEEAWRWATSTDERARNGMLAILAATKACELTDWKSFLFIDTLAAACAEDKDFENAVKWETRALELAQERERKAINARLKLFKSGKPYRQ
jgi:tetratricopeptide (TPR) repeat protein